MRLGLPRLVPAVPVQLVPGQVHPVRRVRSVLLAQQVHIPLAPHRCRGPVRATGRGQLQLVASAHEAQRRPARSRGARVGGRQGHVQRRHAKTGRVQQTVTAVDAAAAATAPTATAVATATSTAAVARATTVVGFVVAAVVRFVGRRCSRRRNCANASARASVCSGSSAPPSAPSTPPPTPVAGTAAKEIGAGRTGAGAVHAAAPGHGRLRVATAGQPVRRGRGRRGCVFGGRWFALLAAQTRAGPTSS